MRGFLSYKGEFYSLLSEVTKNAITHAKWLNSLSYMELMGAKKIAKLLNQNSATVIRLQHAAEEFRHAHHLKRQIEKILPSSSPQNQVLGGFKTLHYLHHLDIAICRLLKKAGFTNVDLEERAYLLVTYAIEMRASELYPIYEEILRKNNSPVSVKSILLEEAGHLEEVYTELKKINIDELLLQESLAAEAKLCSQWINTISN